MDVQQLRLTVLAEDHDAAVAFYRDVLGLEQEDAFTGPGGAAGTILRAGRATLEVVDTAQHREIDEQEVGRPVAGALRVALEVQDAAAATERLVAGGASLVAPPTRTPWRSLNARLDGPAGLHLTVFEEPDVPVLAPVYPIATERLLLRPIDPSGDLDAMHAYLSREDVCAYIPPVPLSREALGRRLAQPDRHRSTLSAEGQALSLAVVLRGTGEVVGDVVLFWRSEQDRSGEIGYVIAPDHQGRGYATEAAGALLALGFDGLGLHRITARIDALNPASGSVLRKAGLRQEAVLVENERFKGRWSTEIDYAILASEWRAAPAAVGDA